MDNQDIYIAVKRRSLGHTLDDTEATLPRCGTNAACEWVAEQIHRTPEQVKKAFKKFEEAFGIRPSTIERPKKERNPP